MTKNAFHWYCYHLCNILSEFGLIRWLDVHLLGEYVNSRPILGPLLFGLLYAVLVIFLLPTMPLNLLAGFIWGPFWGSLIVVISVSVGSVISFMIARSVFYTYFAEKIDLPHYKRLQEILEKDGWKIMIMIRMNPIFPTGPINYVIGSTKIPFPIFLSPRQYSWQPIIALAYAGSTVQTLLIKDFNPLVSQ